MATATQSEKAAAPCAWPTLEAVEENVKQARRVINTVRHAAEEAVDEAELKIRRDPVRAVGAAIAVGALAGALIGFGAGWCARNRR